MEPKEIVILMPNLENVVDEDAVWQFATKDLENDYIDWLYQSLVGLKYDDPTDLEAL